MNKSPLFLGVILQILLCCNSCFSQSEDSQWYPTYHMAPPANWMNDPNGLIFWKGYYHIFYQHYPNEPKWGLMHWGHARSQNLVEWEHLPIALTPSIPEDINGCYSGSAIDHDGNLTLIYTGVSTGQNGETVQVQCLATSNDGVNFEKLGKVIDSPGPSDFRDPKIWKESDGNYYVVIGTNDQNSTTQHGEVLLYRSADLKNWEKQSTLYKGEDWLGYMWECPDFFKLDDKYTLVISPQGIQSDGIKYQNLYQSGYFVGTWQPGSDFKVDTDFTEIDNGHDFYAPQSFVDGKNRRIQIGWLDMWNSPYPEQEEGWAGMMTIPREVKLGEDGKLKMIPVEEVTQLRQDLNELDTKTIGANILELDSDATATEVIISWDINASSADEFGLRLGDPNNMTDGLSIYINANEKTLVLNRSYSKYDLVSSRTIMLPNKDEVTLRVFFDSSSVEVFVDDGEAVLSSRIYPSEDQRHLSLYAKDGDAVFNNLQWWSLQNDE